LEILVRSRWVACAALLTACIDVSGLGFDLGPIRYVDVFPAEATVHVGDSTHMSAQGVNETGYLTHLDRVRTWRVSDTTLASMRTFGPVGDSAVLIAKRPGVVRVEVEMERVLGASQITIVP
jgi:hypothetical protein